jgi:hypothetical protein
MTMSETKFTPGPWVLTERTIGVADTGDYETLFEVRGHGGKWLNSFFGDDEKANAHLMAAAPDLYAVAKAYEAWEADVILNATWDEQELPRLTQSQWDRMVAIQDLRNAALAKAEALS